MFCSSCGKKIPQNSKFCKYCGEKIIEIDEVKQEPVLKKTKKRFLKLAKINGIIWIISIILFCIIAYLSVSVPYFSFDKENSITQILVGSVVLIGILSYLIMVISIALHLSYGIHFNDSGFKKFVRFILSLIFLPIAVMKNIFGVFFGIFVLSPLWGVTLLFVLFSLGIMTNSVPITGNSMNPTIEDKENINLYTFTFIQKILRPPKKGDLITFTSGRTSSDEGEIVNYIKRVVATSGDEVSIRDGFLYVNNQLIKEPYTVKPRSTFGGSFLQDCKTIKVPENFVFVLGDNRKRSKDSREIGFVSVNEIKNILPVNKQDQFKDRNRDASNDGIDQGLPSFELDKYYEDINKIRTDNKLKPLKRNEKLEKAALARAKSIIENNEVDKRDSEKSVYPYNKAIRDAGYSNIIVGEISTTGYYDSDELSNYWLDYKTKENLLDKQYQDTGIAAYVGKVDGCEVQVIVQEFGGYVPPNYEKSIIDSWKNALSRLKSIQQSWLETKKWGSEYEKNKTDYDRINQIISIRISNMEAIVSRMDKNQWLSSAEEKFMDQDEALSNEQQSLANKLNNL